MCALINLPDELQSVLFQTLEVLELRHNSLSLCMHPSGALTSFNCRLFTCLNPTANPTAGCAVWRQGKTACCLLRALSQEGALFTHSFENVSTPRATTSRSSSAVRDGLSGPLRGDALHADGLHGDGWSAPLPPH